MFKFIIGLAPCTKKNSQRLIYAGGRPRIIPSKAYVEYEHESGIYLKELNIDYPVNVKSVFYMPTRRKVDLSNLISALHDILVKHNVLVDDNCKIIYSVDGSKVCYDKENPRTEIEITKVDNYE